MKELQKLLTDYLDYCRYRKNLNEKTLKAYRIDLTQFEIHLAQTGGTLCRQTILQYITSLYKLYKPKSIKRKVASLKAFCTYLTDEEILDENPFSKLRVKLKEPFLLPRTISLEQIGLLLSAAYRAFQEAKTDCAAAAASRDIAVLELLFATGMRVSELCSLHGADVDLAQKTVRIYGKGAKERIVQLGNPEVLSAVKNYKAYFAETIAAADCFFVNRLGHRLSEQSVRFMINKYVEQAGITKHITPHMFRHSFATLLLEADVDIRYIQRLLGHSSIVTTQIYTHVASGKQRDILVTKHPRNKLVL